MLVKTALLDGSADLIGNLVPIMKKYGVRCSPIEFYDAVNLHFHAAESRVYDEIHKNMWQALPRQFELLTEDCAAVAPKGKLRVLDVGCGTGLSAELFLRTRLGSRTSVMHLIDTSREMLGKAISRAQSWPVDTNSHCGKLSDLPASQQFDVILVCSVLHHLADLRSFLNEVAERQSGGGLFLHFQDPNADFADDPDYLSRLAEFNSTRAQPVQTPFFRKLTPRRIYKRLLRHFNGRQDYIGDTNRSLLRAGLIKREMSDVDIWLVTDIRISPTICGVSLQSLKSMLPRYELVSSRSYAFFEDMGDNLPEQFRAREEQLISNRSMTGRSLSGAWRLSRAI